MAGIDFNSPILYRHASFRYFEKNEHHITRFCIDNVLLLVYEGVLRFSEDGEEKEVRAGEYYIQKKNCHQAGAIASDAPQYLYVHFDAEWTDDPRALPMRGYFDVSLLFDLMTRLNRASHQSAPYTELQYLLLKLLLSLRDQTAIDPMAETLAKHVEDHIGEISSLSDLCEAFHYSKNYIIRIFNRAFGMSPIQYINETKLRRAMYLLESTSKPIGEIALECGYTDYPYFYKRFLQKTGIPPLKWRRQLQEHPHMASSQKSPLR